MSLERFNRRELFRRGAEKASQAVGLATLASLFPKSIAIAHPLIPETEPTTITHWDGKEKRINPDGGIKLVFIPGMNTNSTNDHTFDEVKKILRDNLAFDEQDELDMTYNTDEDAPAVGKHYDATHANRSPATNYLHLRQLFLWYREHFKGDKFILFGHSQGGFMSYLLAQEFRDMVAGVITYDSPLKGADIIPADVDNWVAGSVGGEAALYYINRAKSTTASQEVEETVATLRAEGMLFSTFASTTDHVVADQFSFVESANHTLNGEIVQDHFDMSTSDIWPITPSIQEQLNDDLQTLPLSREEKQRVKDNWLGHSAVMINPRVLDQTLTIVKEVVAHIKDPRPDMFSKGQAQNSSEQELVQQEEFLSEFIEEKPSGSYFTIEVTPNDQFYVILRPGKESEGWNEFHQSLTQHHLTNETVWRRLFVGIKYEQ